MEKSGYKILHCFSNEIKNNDFKKYESKKVSYSYKDVLKYIL